VEPLEAGAVEPLEADAVATFELRHRSEGSGPVCRAILATLPGWFGIAASVDDYVAVADRWPTVIASHSGGDVGLATFVTHSPYAAEVSVMGVVPEYHRRGIGRAMLEHVEDALARAGVEFLQVKTQSARRSDEGYDKTRAFYLSYGFRPLEEWPLLWGPENPALQMIKTVTAHPRAGP
jgi:GNAT superfamily N-acetyltransferase